MIHSSVQFCIEKALHKKTPYKQLSKVLTKADLQLLKRQSKKKGVLVFVLTAGTKNTKKEQAADIEKALKILKKETDNE